MIYSRSVYVRKSKYLSGFSSNFNKLCLGENLENKIYTKSQLISKSLKFWCYVTKYVRHYEILIIYLNIV